MHCPSARALAKLPENPEFLPCKDCEQLAGLRERKELQDTPTAQVSVVHLPTWSFPALTSAGLDHVLQSRSYKKDLSPCSD